MVGSHNPASAEHQVSNDNRSNQLNPNNNAYRGARGKRWSIHSRAGFSPPGFPAFDLTAIGASWRSTDPNSYGNDRQPAARNGASGGA